MWCVCVHMIYPLKKDSIYLENDALRNIEVICFFCFVESKYHVCSNTVVSSNVVAMEAPGKA